MNLFLTRQFLYCVTILFYISYAVRFELPANSKKEEKQIEEEQGKLNEEEEEEKAKSKVGKEEAQKEERRKAQEIETNTKKEEEDDQTKGEEPEEVAVWSKLKKAELIFGSDIIKQKWCLSVTIKDVCPNENVTFWLYNKNTNDGYHLDENNLESIKNAPFIKNAPIKVLLHGYNGNKSFTPNKEIRPVYIHKGYNVISIDYYKVVQSPCSIQAFKNSVRVAKCFAGFLKRLSSTSLGSTEVTFDDYHVIGFDIGAQVAGKAGRILSDQDIFLRRITSLDVHISAFYVFSNYISKKSAKFVDAIHTNIMTYGKMSAYGHCDFYVNKAVSHGPCKLTDAECNHQLAAVFFAESIDGKIPFCGFELFSRSKTAIMGEHCPSSTRGIYLVTTNDKPPYARGCNESDKGNNENEEPSTLIKVNKTFTVRI